MNVNLIDSTGTGSAPAAVTQAWTTAANILDAAITDNITVNITVTYTGSGGGASAKPDNGILENYTSVYDALIAGESPGDTTFAGLPSGTSIGGQSQVAVWNSELKLAGLISPNDPTTDDGSANFNTDVPASSMVGVALHEFTHAMGRTPANGGVADVFDFYRFTSQGNYDFSTGTPATAAYFSLDGGLTKWADYGQSSDPSDFLNTPGSLLTPEDPFNEFYDANTLQYLTPADLEQLDALGFHMAHNAPLEDSYDFAGQGYGDILVQDFQTGAIAFANMVGGTFQNWVGVTTTPGWFVMGQGKISGGNSDIVIQNNSTGQIDYAATTTGGAFAAWVAVANAPGYNVLGVGDINDDHFADVVVEDQNSGQIDYANMNGGVFHNWVAVAQAPGYAVRGVGDITGSGYADIVIESGSGQIDYANMSGGFFSGWGVAADAPGWAVVGVGDINRDGYDDVVVQNDTTGQIAYANMNNGVFSGWTNVGTTPGWFVYAVEDVVGNGFDDIVVQNPNTGAIAYADMTDGTFQNWVGVATTPGWALPGTHPAGANTFAMNAGSAVSAASLGLSTDGGNAVLTPSTLLTVPGHFGALA